MSKQSLKQRKQKKRELKNKKQKRYQAQRNDHRRLNDMGLVVSVEPWTRIELPFVRSYASTPLRITPNHYSTFRRATPMGLGLTSSAVGAISPIAIESYMREARFG